jgi:hypothetical protein
MCSILPAKIFGNIISVAGEVHFFPPQFAVDSWKKFDQVSELGGTLAKILIWWCKMKMYLVAESGERHEDCVPVIFFDSYQALENWCLEISKDNNGSYTIDHDWISIEYRNPILNTYYKLFVLKSGEYIPRQ